MVFCPFSFGHRTVCPSIYALPYWLLQTFLREKKILGLKKTFPDFYPENKPTLASAKKNQLFKKNPPKMTLSESSSLQY
jgi:hypothetical protein